MRVRRRPNSEATSAEQREACNDDPELAALEGWEFFLIEANPNPHLATNSELPLAARAMGLAYPDLIERLLENAMGRELR